MFFASYFSVLIFFDIYCQSQEVDSTPDSDSIPTVTYISCAMQFPDQVSNEQNAISKLTLVRAKGTIHQGHLQNNGEGVEFYSLVKSLFCRLDEGFFRKRPRSWT